MECMEKDKAKAKTAERKPARCVRHVCGSTNTTHLNANTRAIHGVHQGERFTQVTWSYSRCNDCGHNFIAVTRDYDPKAWKEGEKTTRRKRRKPK